MMRYKASCLAAALSLFGACDDGRIYDEGGSSVAQGGMTVTLEGEISGCGDYEDDSKYSVVLAAFKADDPFAVVSKPVSDGSGQVTLSNITGDVASVELCVINRLRERIFTFVSKDVDASGETDIILDAGSVNVGKFAAITEGIFTPSCSRCHGAGSHAAAGLDLMPSEAYGMLVNVPSTVVEGEMRVLPGNASASTLWQAVATGASADWAFNHANLLTVDKNEFIENWINSGAR